MPYPGVSEGDVQRIIDDRLAEVRSLVRQLQGEDWHIVGDVTTGLGTVLQGTWAGIGGAYARLAFRFVNPKLVAIKGTVKSGALSTTIFTLPKVYRPSEDRPLPVAVIDGGVHYPGEVYVQASTGAVIFYSLGTGAASPVDEVDVNVVFAL